MKTLLILGTLAAGMTLAGSAETAEAGHRYRFYRPHHVRHHRFDCYDSSFRGYGLRRYGHVGGRYHPYAGRSYFPRNYGRSFGFSYYKHRHAHHNHRGLSIRTPGFSFGFRK